MILCFIIIFLNDEFLHSSLKEKKKKMEEKKGAGEGCRAGKQVVTLGWRKRSVSLNHVWLLGNTTTEHCESPSPSCLKAYVFPRTMKERGAGYAWLRAWLTESSSACLLFIKLHLLDRKGPRPS